MTISKRIRPVVYVLAGMGVAALAAPSFSWAKAPAALPTVKVLRVADVAGRSPYAGRNCNILTPDWSAGGGREGEPMIAVNPRSPDNRIAIWMDRTRSSIDSAYTLDAGRHWRQSLPSHADQCGGNTRQPWEASGDVWATFGPDGTAYISFLAWAHDETPPLSKYVSVVYVESSTDGGKHWSLPAYVGSRDGTADKDMIVADPRVSGTVYAAWRNGAGRLPVAGARGDNQLLFAKTTDSGRSWSIPAVVARQGRRSFFGNPQIVVLSDGTLVYTSSVAAFGGGTELVAYRSTDKGASWSEAIDIARQPAGLSHGMGSISRCGHFTAGGWGQTAAAGRLVAQVQIDPPARPHGEWTILLYWSEDGGLTWLSKPTISSRNPIVQATAALDPRKTLAILWDEVDAANIECARPVATFPASTKLSVSLDRVHWQTVTVGAQSFNLATALVASRYNIGEYHSVAATPSGFTSVTVQGLPLTTPAPPITGKTGVIVGDVEVRP